MSEFEEEFAANAYDSEDDSIISLARPQEIPVKRYATSSHNAPTIIKHLKEENLKMVKNRIKKEESEQNRYLSLDNATKDVEIENFKEQIKKYEKILKPIKEYEEVFKILEKNSDTYKSLIDKVSTTSYKELMNLEIKQIINTTPPPEIIITDFQNSFDALNSMYKMKKEIQDANREKFHEALFWNGTFRRRQIYFYIETFIALSILYVVWCIYLGK